MSIEHQILSKSRHPNIIKIKQSVVDTELGVLNMFQELAIGGDLFSYLSQDHDVLQGLPESEAIFVLYQICKGLLYLHHKGIVHRDLKLDNVLIMGAPLKYPHVSIADFGIAKQNFVTECRGGRRDLYLMKTLVGTAEYTAPEIALSRNFDQRMKANLVSEPDVQTGGFDSNKSDYYTEKVDSWSLGVVGHILLSGISPFYSDDITEIIKKSHKGHLNFNNSKWTNVSEVSKIFVAKCIEVDSKKRNSIQECLESELFCQGSRKELLEKLLQINETYF